MALIAGALADLFDRRRFLIVVMAWQTMVTASLAIMTAMGLVTPWVLLGFIFAVGIGGPSRDMMIKKATPKGATGRVYGLVYSGLDTGFAISPIVFGVFMDRGWYGATPLGAALFARAPAVEGVEVPSVGCCAGACMAALASMP